MNTAVKMAENLNIAVDKSRIAKRSVYQAGATKTSFVSNYYASRCTFRYWKDSVAIWLIVLATLTRRYCFWWRYYLCSWRVTSILWNLPLNCILNYFQRIMRLSVSWKHKWTGYEEAAKITRTGVVLANNRSTTAYHLRSSGWLVHVVWWFLWRPSRRAQTTRVQIQSLEMLHSWAYFSWLRRTNIHLLFADGDIGHHPVQ